MQVGTVQLSTEIWNMLQNLDSSPLKVVLNAKYSHTAHFMTETKP